MKKRILILLCLCLMICGCNSNKKEELPPLEEGIIDLETLDTYFFGIKYNHIMRVGSLKDSYIIENPQYMDKIEYKKDEIEITTILKDDDNKEISIYSQYSPEDKRLKEMYVLFRENDKEYADSVFRNISKLFYPSDDVYQAMKQYGVYLGQCFEVGEWCIFTDDKTEFNQGYYIIINRIDK